ncbi:hypothetical protein SAMN02745166_01266 [Prosthecobacter debontii]|uniref:3-keto-disaccharide hydrolase domain-containing protein n=1 Tax=Prosthecobacter debontii TaxID=48467 RepID=A0A1T4X9E3_9BACT|nr:hypothetical protein [Prosthecobacter debontii]SKA86222.1 hypothetical protein SAMN02745166_01266 [Prosthecobacter debontii]
MIKPLLASVFLASSLFAADGPLLKDDFSNPKLESRRASRGEWRFADHTATCTQDDELYKKFKDHGPIIFYDLAYENATLRFSYKADAAVKALVFTANGTEGHVFRFLTSPKGTGIRAFPADDKDHKSISLGNESPTLTPGEWIPVVVTLKGSQATVKIGDFEKTYEHPSLARPKSNLSIGFSFGTVSVKDVVVESLAKE